jgi:hypothetical protein
MLPVFDGVLTFFAITFKHGAPWDQDDSVHSRFRFFQGDVKRCVIMQHECGFQKDVAQAVFTQLTAAVNTFRDAVRFQDGVEVLLQRLDEGQRVRVLDLSSAEEQETELAGQRAIMRVAWRCASNLTCSASQPRTGYTARPLRLPHLGSKGAYLKQMMRDKLIQHKHYIDKHGEDLREIRNWKWKTLPQ